MFGRKAKEIAQLNQVVASLEKSDRLWYDECQKLSNKYLALENQEDEIKALRDTAAMLNRELVQRVFERDTLSQVLKQLQIPVKLK